MHIYACQQRSCPFGNPILIRKDSNFISSSVVMELLSNSFFSHNFFTSHRTSCDRITELYKGVLKIVVNRIYITIKHFLIAEIYGVLIFDSLHERYHMIFDANASLNSLPFIIFSYPRTLHLQAIPRNEKNGFGVTRTHFNNLLTATSSLAW